MDFSTRVKVRQARDSAVRRSLGLSSFAHVRTEASSTARRWTDAEIEAAVQRIAGGKPISRHSYKVARTSLDPNAYPSHNTVHARRPDLFSN